MPAVPAYLIPAAHDGRVPTAVPSVVPPVAPTARPPAPGPRAASRRAEPRRAESHRAELRRAGLRRARLRRVLRASGQPPDRTDALEAACLAWLAGVLVEIAGSAGDVRTAKLLADEASATLAALSATPAEPMAATPAEPTAATPAEPTALTPAEPTALTTPLPAPLPTPLTRRELVVLRELRENATLRGIADSLHVSHNTVRSQTRSVYRKLGVSSRSQALRRAHELELL